MSLYHGDVGWSVVSDCDISMSYSLALSMKCSPDDPLQNKLKRICSLKNVAVGERGLSR